MSTINDGGPAFPVKTAHEWHPQGLSMRDYFAAQLAPGLLIMMKDDPRGLLQAIEKAGAEDAQDWVAKTAYSMADEMMKAREVAP